MTKIYKNTKNISKVIVLPAVPFLNIFISLHYDFMYHFVFSLPKYIMTQEVLFSEKLATMFANENWPLLYRLILPIAAEYWDTYFSNLLNRFFSKLSFSQVFP